MVIPKEFFVAFSKIPFLESSHFELAVPALAEFFGIPIASNGQDIGRQLNPNGNISLNNIPKEMIIKETKKPFGYGMFHKVKYMITLDEFETWTGLERKRVPHLHDVEMFVISIGTTEEANAREMEVKARFSPNTASVRFEKRGLPITVMNLGELKDVPQWEMEKLRPLTEDGRDEELRLRCLYSRWIRKIREIAKTDIILLSDDTVAPNRYYSYDELLNTLRSEDVFTALKNNGGVLSFGDISTDKIGNSIPTSHAFLKRIVPAIRSFVGLAIHKDSLDFIQRVLDAEFIFSTDSIIRSFSAACRPVFHYSLMCQEGKERGER